MSRRLALVAVVTLHTALAGAPQQGAPIANTGVISGRVLDGDTSAPLVGARVTLGGTNPGPVRPETITDDAGRFAFPALAAGAYEAHVEKAGYLPGGWLRDANDWNAQIVIEAGQRVEDVTLRAWHPATIAGTLRNEAGAPVAGIAVGLLSRHADWSRPSIPPMLTGPPDDAWTDARGRYTFPVLRPGDYIVTAIVASDTRRAGNGRAYATTFFPGTTALAEAKPIVIAAGETRADMDMTLIAQRAFSVAGRVNSQQQPVGKTLVSLLPLSDGFLSDDVPSVEGDANGRFVLPLVRPGAYDLEALRLSEESADHIEYRARTRVVVSDGDQAAIAVTLVPEANLSGRIVFRGTSDRPVLARLPFWLGLRRPVVTDLRGGDDRGWAPDSPPPAPDGQFTIRNLLPGQYDFTGVGDDAWEVASITVGGRDVSRTGITVGQSNLSGVVVTMTKRTPVRDAGVSGVVRMADGSKATDGWVLMYQANLRNPSVFRFFPDGRFGFGTEGAGDYLLSAVPLDPGVALSRDLLATLAKTAVHVKLVPGTTITADVPMFVRPRP